MSLIKIVNRIKSSELLLGSFWSIIGNGLSRVFITLGTILSANFLGVAQFGEFSVTRTTINAILVIAGLNIGTVLTKTISEYGNENEDKRARLVSLNYLIIICFTVILAGLTYFLSENISIQIQKNIDLSVQFEISSVILLFAIVFSLNESIYRGLGLYQRLGVWQIIASLSYLFSVPFGAYKYGVTGAVFGYLVYTIIMTIITLFDLGYISKSRNIKLFTLSNIGTEFAEIKKLTIPIFLSSIIEAPVFWLAQVFLIKYAGMAANGIASALLQTRNLILIIPGYISLVALPLLSKNINDKDNYNKHLQQSLKLNSVVSILCVIPLLIFPGFFLKIYGNGFTNSFNYWDSFFAYVSIPLVVISNVYQQSLIARSKGWNSLFISILWNLLLLITTYVLCKYMNMGVTGYMVSMLLAILAQMLLRIYYDKRGL